MSNQDDGVDTSDGNGSGKKDKRPELTPAEILMAAALLALLGAIGKILADGNIIYNIIPK